MAEPLVVEIDATHLYPGAVGRLHADLPETAVRRDCLIVFADSATAPATLTPGDDTCLEVGAYTTVAGTRIAARRWRVTLTPQADAVRLRVVRRASD